MQVQIGTNGQPAVNVRLLITTARVEVGNRDSLKSLRMGHRYQSFDSTLLTSRTVAEKYSVALNQIVNGLLYAALEN